MPGRSADRGSTRSPRQSAAAAQLSAETRARLTRVLAAAGLPTDWETVRRIGGSSHETWFVGLSGQRLAVRLAQAVPRHAVALATEARVLPAASAAHLAPELVYFDDQNGSCVSRWHPGWTWTTRDLARGTRISLLALRLRELHALLLEVPAYDLAAAAAAYRDALAEPARNDHGLRLRLDRLEALVRWFDTHKRIEGLAHNDLVVGNLIGVAPLQLLDWEYAAPNDRLFDLATLCGLHELPEDARHRLAESFELSTRERRMLPATIELVRTLAYAWARAEALRRPDDSRLVRWLTLQS